MKLADTVMSLLRGGAGATLALAVGCGSPSSIELHQISSPPRTAPVVASGPTAVLVPVPSVDPPFTPTPVASEAEPVAPPAVVAVARPARPRRRAHRNASAPSSDPRTTRFDFSDVSIVGCGRG